MATYRKLREQLIQSGKLAKNGDLLVFTDDVEFASPTAAAVTVSGSATNGRLAWLREDGKPLKGDLEGPPTERPGTS